MNEITSRSATAGTKDADLAAWIWVAVQAVAVLELIASRDLPEVDFWPDDPDHMHETAHVATFQALRESVGPPPPKKR